jgi:hypothetical protein
MRHAPKVLVARQASLASKREVKAGLPRIKNAARINSQPSGIELLAEQGGGQTVMALPPGLPAVVATAARLVLPARAGTWHRPQA